MDYMTYRSTANPGDQNGAMARQRLWSTPYNASLNAPMAYRPIGIGAINYRQRQQAMQGQSAQPAYTDPYLAAYEKNYAEARARELGREKDITQGYMDRLSKGRELVKGLGNQEKRDVNQLYDERGKQAQASVQQQGLTNTSVGQQLQRGIDREHSNALLRTGESIRREQLGVESGLSGDLLAFKERPTTQYPDIGLMTQLAAASAQGGYGYGARMGQNSYGGAYGGGGAFGVAPAFMGTLGMPNYTPYFSSGGSYPTGQPSAGQQNNQNSFWANYRQQQLLDRQINKMNAKAPGVNLGAGTYSADRYSSYV